MILYASGDYYESRYPDFLRLRAKALEMLQRQQELIELMHLVDRGSLTELDKLTVDVAKLFVDDFLQQNDFTDYDRCCPFYKTYGMLRNVMSFYEFACKTLSQPRNNTLTWETLQNGKKSLIRRLSIMKFLCPRQDGEKLIRNELDNLYTDLQRAFDVL